MSATVPPRLARGLRDLLPEQAAARQRLIETIRGVYELYGFMPLETPAIEYLSVLRGSAGAGVQESIFAVGNPDAPGQPEEQLGLRFDLTVPLARVVAQYRELPRPFRRYQVAQVWRADKPDPGRFREFCQFDIDAVGVASPLADVEIIAAGCDALAALDAGPYRLRFSSRRILNLLLDYAGIPGQLRTTRGAPRPASDVLRVLDKLERVGPEKVRLELTVGYTDESGDTIPGLGLAEAQVARIEQFLAISAAGREEVLARLSAAFAGLPQAAGEIELLRRMSRRLEALGYGDDRVAIDLSIARGLDYYTGPVFEALLLEAPQFGAVFGGGRYDELVLRFLGERIPATGASIGVDRLLAALRETGRLRQRRATAAVLVTRLDPGLTDEYLALTFELRRAGIPAELYLGPESGLGKQIKYADGLGVPIALIYGSQEKAKGVVTLKDLAAGRAAAAKITRREEWIRARPGQSQVARAELVARVRQMLARRRPAEPG